MKPNMLDKEKAAMAMIMTTCEQGMGQRGGGLLDGAFIQNCLENSTKNSICLFWSNSSH